MGGKPLTALNIVCFPLTCLDIQVLAEILKGGADVVRLAGAVILGGHTVEDAEPKYGLAVTGIVHPEKVITNRGASLDEVLVLTKPLGTGVLVTALKGEILNESEVQPAIDSMIRLNRGAAECMQELGVRGATDITGFGLLGHAYEMALGSGYTFEFYLDQIPWLPRAREMARMGLIPAGAYSNQSYLSQKVDFRGRIGEDEKDLLFDPQTSGGLLIAVVESRVEELLKQLQARGESGWVIGRVGKPENMPIKIHGR
jgi:selenide,water dikinase